MICTRCQREITDNSNFCCCCGAPQNPSSGVPPQTHKRLMRSIKDRKIAGVCGGIAEYFEIDSTIVRLVWLLAVILPVPLVPAFLGYFVAWIVVPKPLCCATATVPPPPVIIPGSTTQSV